MKILVISDTHGGTSFLEKISDYLRDVDLILHAGDILYHGPRNPLPDGYAPSKLAEFLNNLNKPVIISRGNCDADVDQLVIKYPILSPYSFIFVSPWRILLTHGEDKSEEELFSLGEKYNVNLVIFGHIHTPVLKRKDRVILLNPGSPSLSKVPYSSIGIIEDNKIYIIDIDKKEIKESIIFSSE
ncbi:MAG: YfcE family phosphodiesterase [Dictyoglomus sp. NZ13-RE01]|nr:MAG: YfcE family phosphodiesterase [Dictyoglomus sp. NZ13-RE01]